MSFSRTNQAGRGRRGRLFPLVLGLLVAVPASVSAEETVTLETIRSALREWRSRFSNVRIKWRDVFGDAAAEADQPAPPSFNEYEHFLTDGVHSWVDTRQYREGREFWRHLSSRSPEVSYSVVWSMGRMQSLSIFPGTTLPSGLHTSLCVPLGYVLLPGVGHLPDVLTDDAVRTWDANATLSGRKVVRLEVVDWYRPEEILRIWLDPRHHFLPIRVETDRFLLYWTCDDFLAVPSVGWFPRTGREQLRGEGEVESRWTVTHVAFNEPIDPQPFVPPKPEVGTLYQPLGKMPHEAYYYGGVSFSEAVVAAGNVPVPGPGEFIAAGPPAWWDRSRTSLLCTGAAAGLLIVAWLWRHRSVPR